MNSQHGFKTTQYYIITEVRMYEGRDQVRIVKMNKEGTKVTRTILPWSNI